MRYINLLHVLTLTLAWLHKTIVQWRRRKRGQVLYTAVGRRRRQRELFFCVDIRHRHSSRSLDLQCVRHRHIYHSINPALETVCLCGATDNTVDSMRSCSAEWTSTQ